MKIVLMLCLLSPVAFCLASGLDRTTDTKDEGTSIIIKKKQTQSNGTNKDDPAITAFINGHTLSMNFAQNIGTVDVEISDGQSFVVVTPDNVQAYITNSGSYTVTITLPGGDEYYGNFVVF